MKLNVGISEFNVITFFLLSFVNFIGLQSAVSFISFILRDPAYYNVKKDNVGTISSAVGFYAEVVLIIAEIFIGPAFDLFGRKKIVIVG